MTLQEIYNKICKNLDETIDYDFAKTAINEGYLILARNARLEKKDTIQVQKGVIEYALPTDFIIVRNILKDGLVFTDFSLWGDKLVLTYTPDSDFSLEIYYYYKPPLLDKPTDKPAIPEHFHDLLVYFGCYKYYLQDEEIELAQSYVTMFNDGLNSLRNMQVAKNEAPVEEIFTIRWIR